MYKWHTARNACQRIRALPEPKVLSVLVVFKYRDVHKDLQSLPARREPQVLTVLTVLMEHKDLKVFKGKLEQLEPQEPQVPTEQTAPPEFRDLKS